jgi:uncharacterized protein DUF3658
MNREQAAEIQRHLLDADSAMDRARRAIAGLGKDDRMRFDGLLAEVRADLQSEVLASIYDQHPDLKPPVEEREEPFITSELRWDQVRLPTSISEADVDAIILSVMKPHWRKVAMVVGTALGRCRELGLQICDEALAARIQVLAESGRIEDVGDLRKWRFSEVRLKD